MADSPTLWGLAFGVVVFVVTKVCEAGFRAYTSGNVAKEARRDAALQKVEMVALDARDLAVKYWSKPGDEVDQKQRQASIVARLQFTADLLTEIFKESPDSREAIMLEWQRFHEACTFGEFGSIRRPKEPERASDIEISAYSLIHRATVCRHSLPKPRLI